MRGGGGEQARKSRKFGMLFLAGATDVFPLPLSIPPLPQSARAAGEKRKKAFRDD